MPHPDDSLSADAQRLIDLICNKFDQNPHAGLDAVADLIAQAPDALQNAAAEALLERYFAWQVKHHLAIDELAAAKELGLGSGLAQLVQRAKSAALATFVALPARLADRYELDAEIGGGAFGVVGRYRDLHAEPRAVAIKVARRISQVDSDGMLDEEARVLAVSDGHPGIVTLFDHIRFDASDAGTSRHALVMQHIDGGSLEHNRMALAALSAVERRETAIAWTTQIAGAVGYLHRNNVLHRDLKPANVLLDRNSHLYVADFGLAWMQSVAARSVGVAGTPAYMSPQMAKVWLALLKNVPTDDYRPVTEDDVYALGVMLYQLLTGWLPCESDRAATNGRAEMLDRIARGDWDRQRLTQTGVGSSLQELVKDCLASDPKARPSTGDDLFRRLQRLNQFTSGPGATSPEKRVKTRSAEPNRRPDGEAEQAWLGTSCLQDPAVIETLLSVLKSVHARRSDEPRLVVLRGNSGSGRRYAVESAVFRFNQSRFPMMSLVTLDLDGSELRDDGLAAFLRYQIEKRELVDGQEVPGFVQWLARYTNSVKSTGLSVAVSLALDAAGSLSGAKRLLERAIADRPGILSPSQLQHGVLECLASRGPVVVHIIQDHLLTDPDRCVLLGAVELLPSLAIVFSSTHGHSPDTVTRSAPCRFADVEPLSPEELDRRLVLLLQTDDVPDGLGDLLWTHGHGDVRQTGAVLLSLIRHGVLVPDKGTWRIDLSPRSREHLHRLFAPDLIQRLEE
ncbi:MAG: serine/threonine-protein kinase, partial [Planctomycetota bacterium]|nr:serine/threonine-protein kinase [Planctomycetota bacterium]